MRSYTYYVYILSSFTDVIYIGITNNLSRRVEQHKSKLSKGFTAKYNVDRLVYYETCDDVLNAIAREKQLKSWSRKKKQVLIEKTNASWRDLIEDF